MNRRDGLGVVGAFSCLLFTLSILCPFLQVEWTNIRTFVGYPGPQTYWSFKATYVYFATPNQPIVTEHWFEDYWSGYINYKTVELGLGMNTVLMLMFIAQAFTLLSASFAILKIKPCLFLSAALLDISTTLCMWLTSRAFVYPHLKYAFQAGFWLTLPDAALFLAVFLVGQAGARRIEATRASLKTDSKSLLQDRPNSQSQSPRM